MNANLKESSSKGLYILFVDKLVGESRNPSLNFLPKWWSARGFQQDGVSQKTQLLTLRAKTPSTGQIKIKTRQKRRRQTHYHRGVDRGKAPIWAVCCVMCSRMFVRIHYCVAAHVTSTANVGVVKSSFAGTDGREYGFFLTPASVAGWLLLCAMPNMDYALIIFFYGVFLVPRSDHPPLKFHLLFPWKVWVSRSGENFLPCLGALRPEGWLFAGRRVSSNTCTPHHRYSDYQRGGWRWACLRGIFHPGCTERHHR